MAWACGSDGQCRSAGGDPGPHVHGKWRRPVPRRHYRAFVRRRRDDGAAGRSAGRGRERGRDAARDATDAGHGARSRACRSGTCRCGRAGIAHTGAAGRRELRIDAGAVFRRRECAAARGPRRVGAVRRCASCGATGAARRPPGRRQATATRWRGDAMKDHWWLPAIVAVVLAGCHEETASAPVTLQPVPVRVQAVRRGDISETLTATGETAALSVLRLASPIAGRVTALTVRPGDRLDAGAVAARVMALENEAAVHGFAFLEQAGTLSAAERQRADQLQRDLASRAIALRAPFAAVVAERLHNPGEQVAQNDVLLELFDPQSLCVIAQVPIASASRVRAGMPVEVDAGGTVASGEIESLAPVVTAQTLTVPVRIRLTTALAPPLLHAAVTARITVAQHHDTLLVPPSALLSSAVTDEGVVMVAES